MSMLEHTREFTIRGASPEEIVERFDALTEALIDMEDSNPDLLDSSVFFNLEENVIGATITISHTREYPDAVSRADEILIEAIQSLGDHLTGGIPAAEEAVKIDNGQARSLAVA